MLLWWQERLTEENRAKINSNNKQKQLADEAERLNQQLEDEEEAKGALQVKLTQLTQQVSHAHTQRERERGVGVLDRKGIVGKRYVVVISFVIVP